MSDPTPTGPGSAKGFKGWLERHAQAIINEPGRPLPALSEPGECRVVLQVTGARPIKVIKVIREATGRDILSARELALDAPVVVVSGISQASAEAVIQRLEKAGAKAVAGGLF
jgi:ribosomal protein L7/L12